MDGELRPNGHTEIDTWKRTTVNGTGKKSSLTRELQHSSLCFPPNSNSPSNKVDIELGGKQWELLLGRIVSLPDAKATITNYSVLLCASNETTGLGNTTHSTLPYTTKEIFWNSPRTTNELTSIGLDGTKMRPVSGMETRKELRY